MRDSIWKRSCYDLFIIYLAQEEISGNWWNTMWYRLQKSIWYILEPCDIFFISARLPTWLHKGDNHFLHDFFFNSEEMFCFMSSTYSHPFYMLNLQKQWESSRYPFTIPWLWFIPIFVFKFYEHVFEICHWEKDLDHCFQQGKDRSLR